VEKEEEWGCVGWWKGEGEAEEAEEPVREEEECESSA
jgi:hypothetical protein